MYVIPIIVLALVIAIGTAWSPIFALIIALPLFGLFLVYVGLSRRSDERPGTEAGGEPRSGEGADSSGGVWGEKQPR